MVGTIRRLGRSAVIAALVAGTAVISTVRVEAKGGKGGGKDDAVCSTLLTAINYAYIAPSIRDYLIGIYVSYGCDQSLIK